MTSYNTVLLVVLKSLVLYLCCKNSIKGVKIVVKVGGNDD